MKKLTLLAALLATSTIVMAKGLDVTAVVAGTAHDVCDGTPNASTDATTDGKAAIWGGSGNIPTGTFTFTRTGFDVQCSSNVFMTFRESDATMAGVAAGSAKGNQTFGGTSDGGAVNADAACTGGTTNACTDANVETTLNNVIAAASTT